MRRRWRALLALVVLALLLAWTWTAVAPTPDAPKVAAARPSTSAASAGRAPDVASSGGTRRGRKVAEGDAVLDPTAAPLIVACRVPPDVAEQAPPGTAHVPMRGAVPAKIQGEWMSFTAPPPQPAPTVMIGRVRLEGFASTQAELRWDGSAWECALGPLQPSGIVTGRVVASEGHNDARISVVGCGKRVTPDRDGTFYLDVDPGPCHLQAVRRDGIFTVRSPVVDVDPRSGQEVVLDLGLPAFHAAGVGTQVVARDGGIGIKKVYPGTPADRAGLKDGDLVIALNGDDVSGWTTDEFVDVALGEAGSKVTYTVLRDGEQVDVDMAREAIDKVP